MYSTILTCSISVCSGFPKNRSFYHCTHRFFAPKISLLCTSADHPTQFAHPTRRTFTEVATIRANLVRDKSIFCSTTPSSSPTTNPRTSTPITQGISSREIETCSVDNARYLHFLQGSPFLYPQNNLFPFFAYVSQQHPSV